MAALGAHPEEYTKSRCQADENYTEPDCVGQKNKRMHNGAHKDFAQRNKHTHVSRNIGQQVA